MRLICSSKLSFPSIHTLRTSISCTNAMSTSPDVTRTSVLLRFSGNTIPWNLSPFASMELSANHFAITWVSFSSWVLTTLVSLSYSYHQWNYTDRHFRYKIKYVVQTKRFEKNQGTKYRSLRNTLEQFRLLIPCVSQFYPLFVATRKTCYQGTIFSGSTHKNAVYNKLLGDEEDHWSLIEVHT